MNAHAVTRQTCSQCNGTGTCPTCNGWAETRDADGLMRPCQECQASGASGRAECQRCDGTGQVTTWPRTLATGGQHKAAKP